jgi:MOSC domain-containing protein YiiM/ferredoxin-NADP reductase
MPVLAVNVAQNRTIEVRGRHVDTGIFKTPVTGPCRIDADGLAGDFRVEPRRFGDANHAVHVYPYEHYRFWQDQLRCDPFPFGQFGENLTSEGLLEEETRIGDVLRFGTTVLQVTQPRIPCRKLSARMCPGFAGAFLRSRRVGFYLRVLEPGHVAAGDAIEVLERDPGSPTVEAFVRISQQEYWDEGSLEELMNARDLPAEWRRALEVKRDKAARAERWIGLRRLSVAHRQVEAQNVVSLTVRCARGKPLPPFRGGHWLSVVHRPTLFSSPERRRYALSGSPSDASSYRITVLRRDPSGTDARSISNALWHLDVGDELEAEAPGGRFTLEQVDAASTKRLIFVSGGIGIAPVMSMLEEWTERWPSLPALVVHGDRNGRTHAFRSRLAELQRANPQLTVRLAYEAPAPGESLGTDFDLLGPADVDAFRDAMDAGPAEIFLAGATEFVEPIERRLEALPFEGRVHAERFG